MKCNRRTFIATGLAAALGLIGGTVVLTTSDGETGALDEPTARLARIDAERCIGCARCVNVAPEAYRMNPDTKKAELIEGAPRKAVEAGARACPVDAVIL